MGRSRSTLFLMEQIIVITIFAICAAVCVKILVVSFLMTVDAVDTKNALLAVESAAESHKAFAGDNSSIARILGGHYNDYGVIVYFNCDWQSIDIAEDASFVLHLYRYREEPALILSDIFVTRVASGDQLVSITTAVRTVES